MGPWGSHEFIQKRAEAPSSNHTETEALNIVATGCSILDGKDAQEASAFIPRSHSQRSRSANPMILMSGIPRPPYSLGEQAMRQVTQHFPPVVDFVPLQRNARRLRSIWSIAQAERQQQIEMCTGMAEKSGLGRCQASCVVDEPRLPSRYAGGYRVHQTLLV